MATILFLCACLALSGVGWALTDIVRDLRRAIK